MTRTMRRVLLLVGIGWMFDAMDQGMVSGVMAAIGTDWHLSTLQLSLFSSAGVLGMVFGAALSGWAADRWGRRTVIIATLLMYSVGSGLSAFAIDYPMLLVLRFATGFGLGGELPAASTLVSEFSPLKSRGRNVIVLESFWAWGWIAAALVSYLAIPLYGWRVAFLVGAVPALFAAILRGAVPESPRYLAMKGDREAADALVRSMEEEAGVVAGRVDFEKAACAISAEEEGKRAVVSQGCPRLDDASEYGKEHPAAQSSFRALWSKDAVRTTAVLWVIWFGINFGYYGFVLWTPTLLVGQGFGLVKSFEFTLIMCLAQLPGYFSAAWLVERWGRKPVLIVYFLGTAVAAWLFGQAGSVEQILAFGCLLYFFALGAWGCVYSYTPEAYPTTLRASGAGWAAAFGRIGAFAAPFIVPALYGLFGSENGFPLVFAVLAGVFVVVTLVVALFARETKGISLES